MTINYKEAKERIYKTKGSSIELCKDQYTSWTKKAKFHDKNNDEYFWAVPKNLAKHDNLNKFQIKKTITFQNAQQRFYKQGRNDIELCKEGWNGWSKKSKFYDKIVKKSFISIPRNVFRLKIVHPERQKEKQKYTCKKKYGVEHPTQSKYIADKIKQTNMKKYGVKSVFQIKTVKNKIKNTNIKKYNHPYATQSEEIKNKIKNTNIKKYNVKCVFQNKTIQNKIAQTNMEKYSVRNPMKNKKIQEKLKQSIKKKYGVEYISQSENNKEKIRKNNLKKYGVEHIFQTKEIRNRTSKRYFLSTGEHLAEWYRKQPKPKPAYISIVQNFNNENIDAEKINKYFLSYKENKTTLEILGENIFNTKHYNKYPNKNLNKKPDFKLSNTVYVNVDGLYWHSNAIIKNDKHHYETYKKYLKSNLTLFQFREHEIKNNPKLCKEIVESFLNCHANKKEHFSIVEKIDDKKLQQFLKKYSFTNKHKIDKSNVIIFNNVLQEIVGVFMFKQKQEKLHIEEHIIKPQINILNLIESLIKEKNPIKILIDINLRFQHKQKNELLKTYKIKESTCPVHISFLHTTGKKIVSCANKYKIYDAGNLTINIPIKV